MTTRQYLDKCADMVAKYSSFVISDGLLDGKMGMALLLYRYGHAFQKDDYLLYADDLLEGIIASFLSDTSCDLQHKIMDVAVGINYLHKKKYVLIDAEDYFGDVEEYIEKEKFSIQITAPYWISRGSSDPALLGIIQQQKSKFESAISESEDLSLRTLIDISMFNLMYSQSISLSPYKEKATSLLDDKTVTDSILKLVNMKNLNINSFFSGLAWLLLDIEYN